MSMTSLRLAKQRSTSFVEAHRFDRGQIGLFGLDDVFALVGLLAGEVDRMLEKTEHAVLVGPVVIAMAMIAREHARRRGTDLLGGFELSLGGLSPCRGRRRTRCA